MKNIISLFSLILSVTLFAVPSEAQSTMTPEELKQWAMQQSQSYIKKNDYALMSARVDCIKDKVFIEFTALPIVENVLTGTFFEFDVTRNLQDQLIMRGYVDHLRTQRLKAWLIAEIDGNNLTFEGRWFGNSHKCKGTGSIDNLDAIKIQQ
ncbi:hypothetical protein [Curvivirga aplysinae]|uniref:hypothetical protein n=1 Tax=Curvivirga aplysinae TaxID=2529852 RepID=UPI0012BB8A8C|nr:hypothetical protein [Curvivirga aplysinae]MTI10526.1 hypothetical protein [Curvivirga aplysinae]